MLETGEVKRTLTLYAPASGVITRLGVRSGMEVKPNSNLYTIADLSEVWILADVYEYELPWLELGQMATLELAYLPGEKMRGELTYIAPFLDPNTRTAEVRLELDNSAGKLKPEMFSFSTVSSFTAATLTVPPSAFGAPSKSSTSSIRTYALRTSARRSLSSTMLRPSATLSWSPRQPRSPRRTGGRSPPRTGIAMPR